MNYPNSIATHQDHNLAAKIKEWEAVADKHSAAGSVRVFGNVPPKATSSGAVDSDAVILYKGAPLAEKDVGYFLSDMFTRLESELMKAGKPRAEASFGARDQVRQWREKHLQRRELTGGWGVSI